MAFLFIFMQTSLDTYQFKPHEIVASIGTGGGLWEVAFAANCDSLTFYLQDIQPVLLNKETLQECITYWEKHYQKTINANFQIVIGTELTTNLPQNTFDKVLIINSLHEMQMPTVILGEVKKILKPTGELFIEETLAQSIDQLHEGCGKPLFTENELYHLLQTTGFKHSYTVVREEFWKIFCFSPN